MTYHVVTSWDQASGVVSIYIDGALDKSAVIGTAMPPINTDNQIFLGDDDRTLGVGITLDEVAIYDYALSSEAVATHFALPEPSSHLVAATTLLVICALRAGRARRGARSAIVFVRPQRARGKLTYYR
jgi:hypothetical protein